MKKRGQQVYEPYREFLKAMNNTELNSEIEKTRRLSKGAFGDKAREAWKRMYVAAVEVAATRDGFSLER